MDSKTLHIGGGRFLALPVWKPPAMVPERRWRELAEINDFIIRAVRYDYSRAVLSQQLIQSPAETLRLQTGVCGDISALFESMARRRGFEVISIMSNSLNHAWNAVRFGDSWYLVDVTWNGSLSLVDGSNLPSTFLADLDFRRRYFLTRVSSEKRLARVGLLSQTHRAPDARVVDYERTLEVITLLREIDQILAATPTIDEQTSRRMSALADRCTELRSKYALAVEFDIRLDMRKRAL